MRRVVALVLLIAAIAGYRSVRMQNVEGAWKVVSFENAFDKMDSVTTR